MVLHHRQERLELGVVVEGEQQQGLQKKGPEEQQQEEEVVVEVARQLELQTREPPVQRVLPGQVELEEQTVEQVVQSQ